MLSETPGATSHAIEHALHEPTLHWEAWRGGGGLEWRRGLGKQIGKLGSASVQGDEMQWSGMPEEAVDPGLGPKNVLLIVYSE